MVMKVGGRLRLCNIVTLQAHLLLSITGGVLEGHDLKSILRLISVGKVAYSHVWAVTASTTSVSLHERTECI
jgi:hypothetical protein